MYSIVHNESGTEICRGAQLSTASKAWEYFKQHHLDVVRTRYGVKFSLLDGELYFKKFFHCKLVGTRAPAVQVPGHKLASQWNGERGAESSNTGTCTCGWSETCNSAAGVRQEFRHHLRRVAALPNAK